MDHAILPILLYGSEIWGIELAKLGKHMKHPDFYFERHLEDNSMTKLEIKFYKRLLQVKKHTPTLAVRGELGQSFATLKAICRSVHYFNQIKQKPVNKIIQHALYESMELDKEGSKTWYIKLKHAKQKPSEYHNHLINPLNTN